MDGRREQRVGSREGPRKKTGPLRVQGSGFRKGGSPQMYTDRERFVEEQRAWDI